MWLVGYIKEEHKYSRETKSRNITIAGDLHRAWKEADRGYLVCKRAKTFSCIVGIQYTMPKVDK